VVRVYLAGPMAAGTLQDGRDRIPARRLAAFDHAEAWLRRKAAHWLPEVGRAEFEALMLYNPATVYRSWPQNPRTWAIAHDIGNLVTCQLLLVLPGWERSRGCHCETHVAAECGIPTWSLSRHGRGYNFAKVEYAKA